MDKREFYVVSLEKQVALAVWILAKAESFIAVGDRFGISASTAHYCFQNIIRILASLLGTYIKWPNTTHMQNSANVSNIILLLLLLLLHILGNTKIHKSRK